MVDPGSREVIVTLRGFDRPDSLVASGTALWAVASAAGELTQIDTGNPRANPPARLPGAITGVTAAQRGALWLGFASGTRSHLGLLREGQLQISPAPDVRGVRAAAARGDERRALDARTPDVDVDPAGGEMMAEPMRADFEACRAPWVDLRDRRARTPARCRCSRAPRVTLRLDLDRGRGAAGGPAGTGRRFSALTSASRPATGRPRWCSCRGTGPTRSPCSSASACTPCASTCASLYAKADCASQAELVSWARSRRGAALTLVGARPACVGTGRGRGCAPPAHARS